jgi:chloride channel protein, CIC family
MADSTLAGRVRERYRQVLRSGYAWVSPRRWLRRLIFWGGAVAVGLAATGFAIFGFYADEAFRQTIVKYEWLSLLIVPAGMGLIAYVTRRLFPGSQGSGIPQTIAALQISDEPARARLLSMRIAIGKILLTTIALLSGASVGREGPTVQIGASIMHALGRYARFPSHEVERGLILAGAAAGVAAAFNTPLAGIVFAIEELSRTFEQRTNGTVITAVIFAGVTSLAILGNYTYFGATTASLNVREGWIAVLVCGVVGGLLGGVFARMLLAANAGLSGHLGEWMRERPVVFAAGCGVVLALIGIASGNATYGTGYQEAKLLLEGSTEVSPGFGIFKLLATLVSFVSGIPGGLFAPSLAVGAGLGANLAELLPGTPAGAVVLLGVVAYFTGVVQAPLTAFIIVMEMTANQNMVFSLMATALIAEAVSHLVCKKPLYKGLAESFLASAAPAADKRQTDAQAQTTGNEGC